MVKLAYSSFSGCSIASFNFSTPNTLTFKWCDPCSKYPSNTCTSLSACSSLSWPSAVGLIVCVFEIPSKAHSYGNLATEFNEASNPLFSAP